MSKIYPVITLYQPWATWIMRGWKTIETRTHNKFRCLKGHTILIHSGQTTDANAIHNPYLTAMQLKHDPDEMINGFILGTAFVNDYKMLSEKHERQALIECLSIQRYGLFLVDIVKFGNPIFEKGEVGIWHYDLENKCKVKRERIIPQYLNLFTPSENSLK